MASASLDHCEALLPKVASNPIQVHKDFYDEIYFIGPSEIFCYKVKIVFFCELSSLVSFKFANDQIICNTELDLIIAFMFIVLEKVMHFKD